MPRAPAAPIELVPELGEPARAVLPIVVLPVPAPAPGVADGLAPATSVPAGPLVEPSVVDPEPVAPEVPLPLAPEDPAEPPLPMVPAEPTVLPAPEPPSAPLPVVPDAAPVPVAPPLPVVFMQGIAPELAGEPADVWASARPQAPPSTEAAAMVIRLFLIALIYDSFETR